jgi:hypothetical protein
VNVDLVVPQGTNIMASCLLFLLSILVGEAAPSFRTLENRLMTILASVSGNSATRGSRLSRVDPLNKR